MRPVSLRSRVEAEEAGEPLSGKKAKIIFACGMLYDLEDPIAFLRATAAALHPDGVFVAQLQCLRQTLALRDVGNLCHEHLEFYTLHSLLMLYDRVGLVVEHVEENDVNGGSYRLYARRTDGAELDDTVGGFLGDERDAGLTDVTGERMRPSFADMQGSLQNLWQTVESMVRAGKRVWAYGASTKGNVILQAANLGPELIEAAADRSPEKVGRTTANGIPIRSEDDFRREQPDFALVLPYTFLDEFMRREAAWRNNGGRFIVPIPEVKVV